MAGNAEDAATVLEMFVNDVANLPAEIAHIYEELQAKDKLLKEQRDMLTARDNSLQKHIRQHGSLSEHPKEAQYVEQIRRLHRSIMELQDEKLVLCQKAVELVDKHAKRLDLKLAELVRDGQLQQDALQVTPAQSLMPVPSSTAQHMRQPSRQSPSLQHIRTPSIHATPNIQSMGSPSIAGPRTPGADTPSNPKRQRLNPGPSSLSLQNLPSMPPSSIPAIAIPRVGTPGIKPEHHHMRRTPPSGHSGIKKASAARRRRAEAVRLAQQQQQREESIPDEEDDDDDDDDEDQVEDKRLYCMCQQVSYGSMVGCDDKDCPFEWFHWGCVGLTEEPSGKWYCPTCRVRREKTKGTRG